MKLDQYTSRVAFKAMTWNVSADGLHDDGFVARPDGNFLSSKPLRWDDCLTLDPATETASCMIEGTRKDNAQVADFIWDQQMFGKLVINPLTQKIRERLDLANVSDACRDVKGVLRVYRGRLVKVTLKF